jgi:hypothetical protein
MVSGQRMLSGQSVNVDARRDWVTLQPFGQSNSMGRLSTHPTAASRWQLGQVSQVTRSLTVTSPARKLAAMPPLNLWVGPPN